MTGPDLVALTAELVDIPSVSYEEQALVARLEAELASHGWLDLTRVGDNLIARTDLGRPARVLLGGHSDTVAPNGNHVARIDGDTVWGLGAADMKGGLAVMLALAAELAEPAVDVTYLVYAREEVPIAHSGLREVFAERPDLLESDVAILGEPTGGVVEAGCQGTLRVKVTLDGVQAHTARPWMGVNAIHRLGPLLSLIDGFEGREPEIDGCRYREAVQAVAVSGGVAGNVVPDRAEVVVNHRFAPDRTSAEAESWVRELVAPALGPGDTVELVELAPAAAPGLGHPLLRGLIERGDLEVRAKLGWTDVAFFAERGTPAVNLGPGDATLAHTAEERVDRAALERSHVILRELLVTPIGAGGGSEPT